MGNKKNAKLPGRGKLGIPGKLTRKGRAANAANAIAATAASPAHKKSEARVAMEAEFHEFEPDLNTVDWAEKVIMSRQAPCLSSPCLCASV